LDLAKGRNKLARAGHMAFDREAYLNRIGLDENVSSTENGLEALHRAQTYNIPFENFDIHLDRGISLEPQILFNKLVKHQRGGYCFEQNYLFGMALDAFHFERRPLLARVHYSGELTPRAHLINLVHFGDRDWITDVGFGSVQLRAPIPLERDRIVTNDGLEFRLIESENFGNMLQASEDGKWKNMYSFDLEHVWPIDIEMGNHYTSTHPDFFFTKVRVAVRTNPFGKITLMDFCLREISEGQETEITLEPGPAYLELLETKFGIFIDAPYEALKPTFYEPSET
jgi:N-hydroxyarylamine O-acetyltransferase